VERANDTRLCKACVEVVGGGQRHGIHKDDRIERRALLVVRLDPVEIHLNKLPATEVFGPDGSLDVGNRHFL
jgi:hypothetical protein